CFPIEVRGHQRSSEVISFSGPACRALTSSSWISVVLLLRPWSALQHLQHLHSPGRSGPPHDLKSDDQNPAFKKRCIHTHTHTHTHTILMHTNSVNSAVQLRLDSHLCVQV